MSLDETYIHISRLKENYAHHGAIQVTTKIMELTSGQRKLLNDILSPTFDKLPVYESLKNLNEQLSFMESAEYKFKKHRIPSKKKISSKTLIEKLKLFKEPHFAISSTRFSRLPKEILDKIIHYLFLNTAEDLRIFIQQMKLFWGSNDKSSLILRNIDPIKFAPWVSQSQIPLKILADNGFQIEDFKLIFPQLKNVTLIGYVMNKKIPSIVDILSETDQMETLSIDRSNLCALGYVELKKIKTLTIAGGPLPEDLGTILKGLKNLSLLQLVDSGEFDKKKMEESLIEYLPSLKNFKCL